MTGQSSPIRGTVPHNATIASESAIRTWNVDSGRGTPMEDISIMKHMNVLKSGDKKWRRTIAYMLTSVSDPGLILTVVDRID